jgi:cytochrome c-type biogenesis protein CcmH
MITFWISAALVSAAAAALILHRAARAARTVGGEDPALVVYRRQLNEIDDLSDRGLILDAERRSAHAEAARRLLAAADKAPATHLTATKGGRLAIAVVAALAPLAAIGVYLIVGSPMTPDQPFARRVADWRRADPASLDPDQLVAVMQAVVREHASDPAVYALLARAEMETGDSFSAVRNLQRAIDLSPRSAPLWIDLGQVYVTQAGGEATLDAVKAFQHAAQLDPTSPMPRYFLARAKIAGGDVAGGLAGWRTLFGDLPASDPRRYGLGQEIAIVERTGALPQPAAPPAAAGQQAFIRSMVDALAARLKANPDDPAGWARLIRSYAVLGDDANHAAAIAHARTLFKDRPEALRQLESASSAPQ